MTNRTLYPSCKIYLSWTLAVYSCSSQDIHNSSAQTRLHTEAYLGGRLWYRRRIRRPTCKCHITSRLAILIILQGAYENGKYLEERYGTDAFAVLLDEGGEHKFPSGNPKTHSISAPFMELYGGDVIFAMPYTAEKGYFDLKVEISTLGGHSSVPPRHTVSIFTAPNYSHLTQVSRQLACSPLP